MTTRAFQPDPERRMLDRFNRSERERLLPVWRRSAWRLVLAGIFITLVGAWLIFTVWEAR